MGGRRVDKDITDSASLENPGQGAGGVLSKGGYKFE